MPATDHDLLVSLEHLVSRVERREAARRAAQAAEGGRYVTDDAGRAPRRCATCGTEADALGYCLGACQGEEWDR